MPEIKGEKPYIIEGFNKMQIRSSRFLREKGDLALLQNGRYSEVGSIQKALGYKRRNTVSLTSTTSTSSSTTTTTSTSSSTS